MTEKRFTETFSTMTVTDNQTGREYKCEMGIDTDLLDLLNEQHETITKLKSELLSKEDLIQQLKNILEEDYYKKWKKTNLNYIRICEELAEENRAYEKLSEENEQLKKSGASLGVENDGLIFENEQLKSTIAQLIEQNSKNNDLLLSDIRILEKALWCSGCENDFERLRELRKEFMR